MAWMTWRTAMAEALYGPGGFYRRAEGPAGHFRTSVHASPYFAAAVATLARAAGLDAVIDLGAGRGELLRALHRLHPELRLHGVDVVARPPDLPDAVSWSTQLPGGGTALLFANEWLDAVPVDVVEVNDDGPRIVEVEPTTGEERLGAPPDGRDAAWLDRWWPLDDAEHGDRAEIGHPRDDAWAAAIGSLASGLAVAADYGHDRTSRPPFGTLSSYREGRQVPVVPDGSCDLSVHVAFDACAVAGERAGATATLLTTQRVALRSLGLRGARPSLDLASSDPQRYLRELQAAGQQAELLAPGGLGGFGWLVQGVAMALPSALVADRDDIAAGVSADDRRAGIDPVA